MQRKDVEHLARTCSETGHNHVTATEVPRVLRALIDRAERAEAEITRLVVMERERGWKLAELAYKADKAEAERDAAFAAGQRDMQERAIQDVAEWGCLFLGSGENVTVDVIDDLRDLPIMTRPDGR